MRCSLWRRSCQGQVGDCRQRVGRCAALPLQWLCCAVASFQPGCVEAVCAHASRQAANCPRCPDGRGRSWFCSNRVASGANANP